MKSTFTLGILGKRVNDLYVFDHHQIKTTLIYNFSIFPSTLSCQTSVFNLSSHDQTMLWHNRLGHVPLAKLKELSLFSFKCTELNIDSCLVCVISKQENLTFPINDTMTKNLFDLIHVDVWGPYKHTTYDGHKYFITIIDDHTRHTWVHLMSQKLYAFHLIKSFVKMVKTQFNMMVKVIRTDNAIKLGTCSKGISLFQDNGILHHKSTPNNPQQNGVVERKHQHILATSRALYFRPWIGISY